METAALSKPGGRKVNQDAYGFELRGETGCWAVADGLGGHAGGETASRMAVDAVLGQFCSGVQPLSHFVEAGFDHSQQLIRNAAGENFVLAGMRTTLVVLVSDGEQVVWGHIGDTRLYWFRDGKILHQTRDHSVPQMLVDAGKITPEDIRGHEDQNRLTKALGQDGGLKVPILTEPLVVVGGDVALLCSDGIWTYVLEQEMESLLAATHSVDDWLAAIEQKVLERAEGEHDNYTAIAVLFSRSMEK